MYDLEYAKRKIMENKKFFDGLEIFSIYESQNEWFFVINGISKDGDIALLQPYERAFNKVTGDIRVVFSQKEDKYIESLPQIFCRQATYKENLKIIKDCYKDYVITSSYESENYHMFNIVFELFKLHKTILIHRFNGKIQELKQDDSLVKAEVFKKI